MPAFPDFLTMGHVTRDLHPDGTFSLGGTVTFAALTAHRLGLSAGIVTCVDGQLATELPQLLPDIAFHLCPSSSTTTFMNLYQDGFRTQYLHARAEALLPAHIPQDWRAAPIVLLAPLAQEFDPAFVTLFARRPGAIIAATPQGWLRQWDTTGRVWPAPWLAAEEVLPLLDALILSHDDLLPFADGKREEADAMLARWSLLVPLLVATDGRYGATLFRHGTAQRFPAYAVNEADPTGAGDVFAAAFLMHLHTHGEPEQAVDFANCAASFSVQQQGIAGIPTLAMVEKRLRSRDR